MILEGTTSSGAVVPVQVTDQGRVVAEGLEGPQGPQGPQGPEGPPGPSGGLWERTGTTVSPVNAGDDIATTGTVTANILPSNGALGFRNVLINGDLFINQRGVTIEAAANGEYGPDRWKKVDANNMTQIVEEGNFLPNTGYTLSGTGIATQQLTSPSFGNWEIPSIPITATNIQLEVGPVATPYEVRPIGYEQTLCNRYYLATNANQKGYNGDGANISFFVQVSLPVRMRVAPTCTFTSTTTANVNDHFVDTVETTAVLKGCRVAGTGSFTSLGILVCDAEL